jgi:sugar/nucleoside kinase (ribokinase family)
MAQEGVDTTHLVHVPGAATPISGIMIEPGGERTAVHSVATLGAGDVFHGAFALAITEKQELAGTSLRLRRRSPEMRPLWRRLGCPATP